MNKPLASIIIRTKNEERWISSCLSSVFNQDFKDFEVIVVDNDSQDKTVEKAKQFPVKLLSYSEEFRPGKAINFGIRNSVGEYIVIISSHCVPVNNQWLGNLVEEIKEAGVAGAYGRQEPLSFTSDLDKRDLLFTFGLERKIQTKDNFFHNANSIIKRAVWEEIPFDEEVLHIEDAIWAREILKRGYKIIYTPEASIYHHHGIHHNGNPTRAKEIVEILEGLKESKKDNNIDIKNLKIVGIVPSKGKIEYLGGKPLIEYTLKRASESEYLSKIAVVTDNPDTVVLAKDLGADFSFLRPAELSADYVELQKVFEYTISQIEKEGIVPDIVVFISPTCPFRPKGLIDKAVSHLVKQGYDSVIPVFPEYHPCWVNEEGKMKRMDAGFIPSRFKEPVYVGSDGLVEVIYADIIRKGEGRLGEKLGMIKLDDMIYSIDIGKTEGKKVGELLIEDWWEKNQ